MDGENNRKPYEQMDDLGEKTLFLVQHLFVTFTPLILFRE